MQCPICNGEMEMYREETTHSEKTGVIYKHARYVCRKDDVWGRLELPQDKQRDTEIEKEAIKI